MYVCVCVCVYTHTTRYIYRLSKQLKNNKKYVLHAWNWSLVRSRPDPSVLFVETLGLIDRLFIDVSSACENLHQAILYAFYANLITRVDGTKSSFIFFFSIKKKNINFSKEKKRNFYSYSHDILSTNKSLINKFLSSFYLSLTSL